ncbi:MAG: hypothetical protein PS018_17335 [bacterium]|nr:hypothetical protein [bacterium]
MTSIEDRFKRTVAGHDMTIVHEDGLHRHLTFMRPGTYNNHFHISTWPGYLAISGDIGTYVFARLPDMFKFFRGEGINPQYWAEKLQAVDRHGAVKEFSEKRWRAAIKSDFGQWTFENNRQKAEAWRELQRSGLANDRDPESLENALRRVAAYQCPVTKNRFNDFWDHDLQDYTFRFLWCCHAIRWAIAEYDRRSGFPHKQDLEGAPIGAATP